MWTPHCIVAIGSQGNKRQPKYSVETMCEYNTVAIGRETRDNSCHDKVAGLRSLRRTVGSRWVNPSSVSSSCTSATASSWSSLSSLYPWKRYWDGDEKEKAEDGWIWKTAADVALIRFKIKTFPSSLSLSRSQLLLSWCGKCSKKKIGYMMQSRTALNRDKAQSLQTLFHTLPITLKHP